MKAMAFVVALVLSASLGGCEACDKSMTVKGTVTDLGTEQPLADVDVYFGAYSDDMTGPMATTLLDGSYEFEAWHDFGGYAGAWVRFEKTGYSPQDAEPFSYAEAGIERCGDYSVVRDGALSP